MKTYLLIYDNQCQRCHNRWTTSYVCNTWAAIVSPSLQVETISGFFHQRSKHQACFKCIEPSALALPPPYAHKDRPLATPPSTPAKAASLDDILGD